MLETLSDTIRGLTEAASRLQEDAPSRSQLTAIVERGEFRPDEDEAIGFWFARFLSVRESLWTAIGDVLSILRDPETASNPDDELPFFLVGYAAVCLLIRIDRIMLFQVAFDSLIQRKLNEAFPEYGVPRKQFTTIFSGFVDQKNVFAIRDAMKFRRKHSRALSALRTHEHVGFIADNLADLESSLNPSKLSHLKRAWSYVMHKWRRRGVVTGQKILAGIMEGVGRTASEFCEMRNKRVTPDILHSVAEILQPGDVIVTRHAKALTNLFLPGFWPHAALYIGTPRQRMAANIKIDLGREQRWVNDVCMLEALKDGVNFRPLRETLAVDVFAVLRPNLDPENIKRAIERAVQHEGKMYKFDFDFFSSDRVVCTEVVYRAYDGLEDLRFPLHERGGRKTLSAEDLLDFALDTNAFTPVAIFGLEDCEDAILYGDGVRDALAASYRRPASGDRRAG